MKKHRTIGAMVLTVVLCSMIIVIGAIGMGLSENRRDYSPMYSLRLGQASEGIGFLSQGTTREVWALSSIEGEQLNANQPSVNGVESSSVTPRTGDLPTCLVCPTYEYTVCWGDTCFTCYTCEGTCSDTCEGYTCEGTCYSDPTCYGGYTCESTSCGSYTCWSTCEDTCGVGYTCYETCGYGCN